MSKFRKLILLFGCGIICIVASLVTFLGLSRAGALVEDATPIVYTVQNISKPYDGLPLLAEDVKLTEGTLQPGHSAVVAYTGSITEVGEGTSDAIIKIVDEENKDVSKNYSIKVKKGKLTVTPQDISIVLDNCVMEYSGEELICDNYQVVKGALASGHRIVATSVAKIVDVEDTLNSKNFVPVIYDAFGKDVSYNYTISFSIGSNVKITPRKLAIKPVDIVETYNGETIEYSGYEIVSGTLVYGHTIVAEYTDENGEPLDLSKPTSKKSIMFKEGSVRVFNEEGDEVTENYNLITSGKGSITIKKPVIKVNLKDYEKNYDGKSLSDNKTTDFYTVSANDYGVTLKANFVGAQNIQAIGEYKFSISDSDEFYLDFKVEQNGKDVTEYYTIELGNGMLGNIIIKNYEIDIDLNDFTYDFSGKEVSLYKDSATSKLTDYVEKEPTVSGKTLTYTVDGISYFDEYGKSITSIKDAGTYYYEIQVTAKEGTEKSDLKINCKKGKITIKKLEIEVSLKEFGVYKQDTFDRSYSTLDGYKLNLKDIKYTNDTLPKDMTLEVSASTLSVYDFNKEFVGTYSATFELKYDKKAVSKNNYDITVTDGTVKVTRPTITVELKDIEKKYGEEITITDSTFKTNYVASEKGVPTGYTLRYVSSSCDITSDKFVEIGNYTYTAKFELLDKNNKVLDSSYYDITVESGDFSRIRKEVNLTLNSTNNYNYNDKSVYEQYSNTISSWISGSYTLASGDTLSVNATNFNVKDAGTYEFDLNRGTTVYYIDLIVKNSKGKDVTKNYEFTYSSKGKVVINKKEITGSGSASHTYNGQAASISESNINVNGLAEGHKISSFKLNNSIIHINDLTRYGGAKMFDMQQTLYVNSSDFTYTIEDKYGKNVTSNYDLQTIDLSFTFNKRSLVLVVSDKTMTLADYNANKHYTDTSIVSISSTTPLAAGDYVIKTEISESGFVIYGDIDVSNEDHYNINSDDTGSIIII